MSESFSGIPLAQILRAANGLVTTGLIEGYALGGALAAIYYVEPFTTYDADIFFVPKNKGLSAGIPEIFAHLKSQGWTVEGEHLLCAGFPVQFLAAAGLTDEAVRDAEHFQFDGVPARIFRAEYIVAIAASVGRLKDRARIEQLLEQAQIDNARLRGVLDRHNLKLPAK